PLSLHLQAERRAKGAAADLRGEVVAVVARRGALDRAALAPERGARGAVPGAARVLLLPRLLSAAGDLHPVLRVVRTAPGAGAVVPHGLVEQVALDRSGEDVVRKGDGSDRPAARVLDFHLGHVLLLPPTCPPPAAHGERPCFAGWSRTTPRDP